MLIFIDNLNNFSTTHRRPQIDDAVEFISRASNTMQQSGGMVFMKNDYGGTFLSWIKADQIVQIITRMSQIIFVRNIVVAIIRMYQYLLRAERPTVL